MNVKRIILFFAAALGLLTSCVENLNEPNDVNNLLSGVEAQVEAMQKSAEDMKALNEALGECGVDVADAEKAISQHLASIKKGASLETATLATLELQKKIAAVVGAAEGAVLFEEGYAKNFKKLFEDANSGIAMWLGESFSAYYQVAVAQAKIDFVLGDLNPQIEDQQMYVDAIMSDIEAGLRKDENPAEITELAASVKKMSNESEDLASGLASLAEELEAEYKSAITANSDFDSETLIELNKTALTKADSATPTLVELAAEVVECQAKVEELTERLGEVEAEIGELIAMIQSLTFVSEYSDDKAVAYYSMTDAINQERYAEGKKERVPAETFDLTFLVRPAAAADALAQTWQESLSVVGYYANRIQQQATVNIQSFDITNAVATHGKGLLTVTVNNAFDDEFYFKEKGAMLALSVESGKNNCASKFVEIVPRDISGKVYAESIKLTPTTLSLQNGDVFNFVAEVTPSNVTDQGFVWEDYDSEYFTVDANGQLTATAVGSSQVLVTANATDEFGRQLSATCNVTVTPAIRIVGPQSVEIGKSAVMEIESPNYINPTDVTWELEWAGNSAYLALTDNKDATCTIEGVARNFGRPAGASDGASSEYLPINVKCTIGGNAEPVVLMHSVCVVEVQPRVIVIDGLANDQNKMTVKKGRTYQFNSSIEPAGVNMDLFGIIYQSGSSHVATIDFRSGLLTTVGYGTANISVEVNDKTSESYFYPKRELFQKFERVVAVTVEPYWVVGLSLPRIEEPLAPESTGTFTPIFTSDVEGEQPSVQSLIWESSNEDVIEVDPETGAYKAKGVGTATITATTTGEWSTKGDPISATCEITVELLENLPTIGDYYYLDGTWSSTYTAGNNPIGVVFAIVDATRTDSKLDTKMDKTTALVVGLDQYNSTFGAFSTGYTSAGKWFVENGYDNANTAATNGYSNSIGLSDYRDVKQSGASGVEDVAFNLTNFPSGTSGWYIPSYYEMKLLYGQKSVINNSLKNRGTEISDDDYWISSLQWTTDGYYDVMSLYPFSMSSGDWGASKDKSTSLPVRVVLAF